MSDVSCRHAQRLAARAELGDLGDAERMVLELHVQSCDACAVGNRRVRGLAELLREEPEQHSTSDLAIIGRALLQAGQPVVAPRPGTRRWSLAAAAGFLLAAGVGTTALFLDDQPSSPNAGRSVHATEPVATAALPVTDELLGPCPGVSARGSEDLRGVVTASRERECRIELERGTLDMRVEPRQRTRVSILTPHTTVRVLGTVLSVSVDSDETRVTVERGLVQVDAGEVPVELSAHERGLISPRVGIDVRAATQEQLAPLRALAEELLLDPLALAPTTPTVEPPAPDPQPALEVAPAEEPDTPVATRRRVRDLRRMLVAQPPAEVRSRVQEELENPRMARRRAELLTIVAESHLAERDYESALATYGRVWRGPRSSTAANALIAGADVALLRVHEPTRARGLYERYLAEYPNGALREVASAGRCRAIAAVGARDAARRCAVEYDLAYPEGRFGGQLEGLR